MAEFSKFRVDRIRVYPKSGRVRTTADGVREAYWEMRITRDGQEHTLWTGWGTRDHAAKAAAELRLAEVEEAPWRPGSMGFLLAGWLGSVERRSGDLAEDTRNTYRNDVGHLVEGLGHARASTLSTAQVEDYVARALQTRASGTVQGELKRLRAAWKWARTRRAVPDRDLIMPPLNVTTTKPKYTPSRAEVRAVITKFDEGGPRWAAIALRLILATGARVSEIGKLTWGDVHETEIILPGKGGRPRPFPRTQGVNEALELAGPRRAAADTITGRSVKTIRAQLGAKIKEAGGRFTPHGVRRCVEDVLAEKGIDIAEYAALLGHSPTVALAHYRRSRADSRARAAGVLDED